MTIDNDEQLNAILLHDLSEVVNDVAQDILDLLKEKMIDVVYDPNEPRAYKRQMENGGLLGSWMVNSSTNIGKNKIVASVEQDPYSMVLQREGEFLSRNPNGKPGFIHGSVYGNGDYYSDIRNSLAEIIIEGLSGNLFGDGYWRERRDFWTPLIDQLDGGGFDRIVQEAFLKRGIKIY